MRARFGQKQLPFRIRAHRRVREFACDVVRSQVARGGPATRKPVNVQRVIPNVKRLALIETASNKPGDCLGFALASGHSPRLAPACARAGNGLVCKYRRAVMKSHKAE